MPQAIPIVVSLAAGWGGTAFAGTAIGASMTAAMGGSAIAGAMTAAIGGAVLGAGLGALGAAVTGGDIGRGALYGAVGGAVSGGIGGYMQGVETTSVAMDATPTDFYLGEPGLIEGPGGAMIKAGVEGTKQVGTAISDKLAGSLVEGGMELAGGMLTGYDESEEAQINRDWQAEQAALERDHAKDMAKLSASLRSGGGDSKAIEVAKIQQQTAREQLAENRRQYDTDMSEARAMRASARKALLGAKAARKGKMLQGTEASIDQQVAAQETGIVEDIQQQGGA